MVTGTNRGFVPHRTGAAPSKTADLIRAARNALGTQRDRPRRRPPSGGAAAPHHHRRDVDAIGLDVSAELTTTRTVSTVSRRPATVRGANASGSAPGVSGTAGTVVNAQPERPNLRQDPK